MAFSGERENSKVYLAKKQHDNQACLCISAYMRMVPSTGCTDSADKLLPLCAGNVLKFKSKGITIFYLNISP